MMAGSIKRYGYVLGWEAAVTELLLDVCRWALEELLGQMGGGRSLREIRLSWLLNAFCRRSAPGKLGCGIAGHKRKRLLPARASGPQPLQGGPMRAFQSCTQPI